MEARLAQEQQILHGALYAANGSHAFFTHLQVHWSLML